jgi:hypothetical protein
MLVCKFVTPHVVSIRSAISLIYNSLIINNLKSKKPLPKQEVAFLIKNTEGVGECENKRRHIWVFSSIKVAWVRNSNISVQRPQRRGHILKCPFYQPYNFQDKKTNSNR